MRSLSLVISFAALVGLVLLCWQHRFEHVEGSPEWKLADLRAGEATGQGEPAGVQWLRPEDQPRLRLDVGEGGAKIVHRLRVPDCGVVKFLHLRIRLRGDELMPGKQIWEDGRVMIEWHQAGVDGWKIDAIDSVRHNQRGVGNEFVVKATKGGAVPVMRLEHLGIRGAFELEMLELRELRETAWWLYGRWVLAIAWVAWACAVIRSWPEVSMIRALAASMVFVTMGALVVVPGPWKIQRPLIFPFAIKENPQGVGPRVVRSDANQSENLAVSSASQSTPKISITEPQQPLGKIPVQGGLLLKAKYFLAPLRPLLHALLIMAPALAMAWLAGWRPALLLAVILSIGIELAQIAFGYGFDRIDVLDLTYDAIGIGMAMLVFHFIAGKRG